MNLNYDREKWSALSKEISAAMARHGFVEAHLELMQVDFDYSGGVDEYHDPRLGGRLTNLGYSKMNLEFRVFSIETPTPTNTAKNFTHEGSAEEIVELPETRKELMQGDCD